LLLKLLSIKCNETDTFKVASYKNFDSEKENLNCFFFNRLNRPVEESRSRSDRYQRQSQTDFDLCSVP